MSNSLPASAKAEARERKKQERHPKQLKKARTERLLALAGLSWKVLTVKFAILGAVLTVRYFATRIAVAPGGTVSAQEALGTVFNVTNNGLFTLHDVSHVCEPNITFPSDNTIGSGIGMVHSPRGGLGDLDAGMTKSLACEKLIGGVSKAKYGSLDHLPAWVVALGIE